LFISYLKTGARAKLHGFFSGSHPQKRRSPQAGFTVNLGENDEPPAIS
jgi:hypothetical protein